MTELAPVEESSFGLNRLATTTTRATLRARATAFDLHRRSGDGPGMDHEAVLVYGSSRSDASA